MAAILPWILGRDSLGRLSRYKMADNLRRRPDSVSQLGIILRHAQASDLPIVLIPAFIQYAVFSHCEYWKYNVCFMALMQDEQQGLISNIPGANSGYIEAG